MAARPRKLLRLVEQEAPETARPEPTNVVGWDDSELIAAVRDGDDAAATAFHDRLRPCVERTIRRLLRTRDADTEDLGQVSMIALVESIGNYRGASSLEAWASTVTAHTVYKYIRRRKLERRIFSDTPSTDIAPASCVTIDRTIIARDLVQRLRTHLGTLTEEKAWTFLLHDVCGFDLREIAEITGVTAAAAQGRLVRGRREIRDRVMSDPEFAEIISGMPE